MLINGFIFGLISTLHCAGMCGPLAMYVPQKAQGNKFAFASLYQIGRISIYIGIGSVVFLLGASFSLFKMQQYLSVGIGALMVIYVLVGLLKWPRLHVLSNLFQPILTKLSKLLQSKQRGSAFILGVLNGLLPCGAIYIAALYCASFQFYWESVIYMGLFGIGTMPVFIAGWFFASKKLSIQIQRFTILYKFLPLIVGVLMILRGSNLGIPYLSPNVDKHVHIFEVNDCCKH
jgi:sulfite exporter TauE/SafE